MNDKLEVQKYSLNFPFWATRRPLPTSLAAALLSSRRMVTQTHTQISCTLIYHSFLILLYSWDVIQRSLQISPFNRVNLIVSHYCCLETLII